MSAIDDLTTVPAQPEISEGNKTFSQKTYALYVWIRTKLVPAMVELRDLIVNAITGSFTGVSSNSITITDTGEVSLNTDAGRSFKPGTPVRLAYVTDPRNYIDGITKTYNATTGELVFYAQAKAGSGTYTNWSLIIIPSGGGLAGLGSNTFVGAQYVPDDAYNPTSWNGSNAVPTKNAIRNKIESLIAGLAALETATSDTQFSSISSIKSATPEWVVGRLIRQILNVTVSGSTTFYEVDVPSWAKEIDVILDAVSTNGTSLMQIQLATASGYETTGYNSVASNLQNGAGVGVSSVTSGFHCSQNLASEDRTGSFTLKLLSNNIWVCTGNINSVSGLVLVSNMAGKKALAGQLTKLKITTVNGTDVIDSGTITVKCK